MALTLLRRGALCPVDHPCRGPLLLLRRTIRTYRYDHAYLLLLVQQQRPATSCDMFVGRAVGDSRKWGTGHRVRKGEKGLRARVD
eukprot:2386275-Pyramimonas_sp.AAC.1